MKRLSTLVLLLLTVLVYSSNVFAQADFDGDGKSDYTMVTVEGDDSLGWSAVYSSSSTQTAIGSLGSEGDHIILARWKGTSKSQIGVVGVSGKNLVWKIKNDDGQVEEREFGTSNFTAISGGDFDGDGAGDAAVAVLKKKAVQWQVSYGLFNGLVGQSTVSKISFGQAGDRIFFASPDGKSDWLGTIGKGLNGKGVQLRLKSMITGEVKSSTKFPKYIVQGDRPRPIPVKQENGVDLLAFARVIKNDTVVDLRDIEGAQIVEFTLPGKGDVVVGNFTADGGEEIAIKTTTGFTVYSPVSKQTTEVTSSNGIAVDEVNVNTFKPSSGNNGNNGGNNGGNEGEPPPAGNDACSSVVSWPSSHIYKRIGSNHFTDVRRNTAGVIIKAGGRGPFPSCINIVDTKGNVVAMMGRYAIGEGLWAARFYSGIGCGSSTPYGGSTIASRATSNTGSPYVYANFGSVCLGPINPNSCIGSAQC